MLFRKFFYRFGFISVYLAILLAIGFSLFYPIFITDSLIIPYSFHPYDICKRDPVIWYKLKGYFILFYVLASIFIGNFVYSRLEKKFRF